MDLLILLNLFIILFTKTFAEHSVTWNSNEISKTIEPYVRQFSPTRTLIPMFNGNFHRKFHFDIIIKRNTAFTIEYEAEKPIEACYFYCFSQTKSNSVELTGQNKKRDVVFSSDCVPMVSVSNNVPVKITLTTTKWAPLPTYNTKDVAHDTPDNIHESENNFYKKLQIFGFVEDWNTQMLLSASDVKALKRANFNLYEGMKNQADLLAYYDHLIVSNHAAINNYQERSNVFFRTEKCNDCKTRAEIVQHELTTYSNANVFLNPARGSEWILLHAVGHLFIPQSKPAGLGSISEVWNNIFATLYQYRNNVNNYWINASISDTEDTLSKYKNGIPLNEWGWRSKLHFFMSLFGYDGTGDTFREFNYRYLPQLKFENLYFNNMIPTLVEVFIDLHNVNILPYLRKVVNFNEYSVPLINPDLELRALSKRAIMPAIEFDVPAGDIPIGKGEQDLRFATPLVLLPKVPEKYVWVEIKINSPINLLGRCLYLNNICYEISDDMQLKLLADVYSSYIATKHNDVTYVSDIAYHTVNTNMTIHLNVEEMAEQGIYSPMIYYNIDAYGIGDRLFARIFVNYKDSTIAISQFTKNIHNYFPNEVYFSIKLKRGDQLIFHYDFLGMVEKDSLVNAKHKFEAYDVLEIYYREPFRSRIFTINGKSDGGVLHNELNTFSLNQGGLKNEDEDGHAIINADGNRISEFREKHQTELENHELYKHYLDHYARRIKNLDYDDHAVVPNEWFINLPIQRVL